MLYQFDLALEVPQRWLLPPYFAPLTFAALGRFAGRRDRPSEARRILSPEPPIAANPHLATRPLTKEHHQEQGVRFPAPELPQLARSTVPRGASLLSASQTRERIHSSLIALSRCRLTLRHCP